MGNDDMKPESNKKGFPGGFFVFLLALVLVILTVQNLSHERKGKVAFSYQLEHLVNLDLIQKEENRKIALNDNLVSFSGKFKDKQTDEAKLRYRYLELLNRNHELTGQRKDLDNALAISRAQVKESASLFLLLTGMTVPKGGFVVVDPIYNTASQDNAIALKLKSDQEVTSLADLQKLALTLAANPNATDVSAFGRDLLVLIERFRSPALGIGTESIKQQLKTLNENVAATLNGDSAADQQLASYSASLTELGQIAADLGKDQQNVRLLALRSVRTYKAQIEQAAYISDELEKNDAQLDKARQSVANVTWFFNNQELSTRTLEKQDPEAYGHWFAQAQQEWENFGTNKMTAFKAPDQPRNAVLEKTFKSEEPSPNYLSYVFTFSCDLSCSASLFRLL